MCVLVYARTHTQNTWVLDVSPGVGRTPGEPEESRFEVTGSILAKTQKTKNSNQHGFELRRPSSKGTKLLFQVIKIIINQ